MDTRYLGLTPRWLWPAAALALFGCPHEDLTPIEPCTVAGVSKSISTSGVDKVDLLFMIDNSGSMKVNQENITAQLPHLVKILASGDKDGDTKPDFTPVSSLHLAVVTTDMGTQAGRKSDYLASGHCNKLNAAGAPVGDDGVMVNVANVSKDVDVHPGPECAALNGQRYQTFIPSAMGADPKVFADQFACIAGVGTKGCGLEQPLESIWKALGPSAEGPSKDYNRFVYGVGHGNLGDKANAGFLRDDSVLAIISVTDEEDCSVTGPGRVLLDNVAPDATLNAAGFVGQNGFNYRCAAYAENAAWIQPVSRYHDGLLALKPKNPERVIFAGIVGVPEDIQDKDFDVILNDPRMKNTPVKYDDLLNLATINNPMQVQPNDPKAYPKPACIRDTRFASPARRSVQLAKSFNNGSIQNGVIRSICSSDFSSALDVIIGKIAQQLSGACLPRALAPNAKGLVECDVVELLSVDDHAGCRADRGRIVHPITPTRVNDKGETVTVCKVNQVAVQGMKLQPNPEPLAGVSGGVGWYYDTFSPGIDKCPVGQKQRIAFYPEDTAKLASGATAQIECFSAVGGSPNSYGKAAVGSICTADADCKKRSEAAPGYQLGCEPSTKLCEIVCEGDQDCPENWVCSSIVAGGKNYCIDATCPPVQSTGSSSSSM